MSVVVNFAWDANPPGDNVTAYFLHRSTISGNYTDPGINMGTNLIGSDTITVSNTYFWTLTAQNANGISPLSNEITEFVDVSIQTLGLGRSLRGFVYA